MNNEAAARASFAKSDLATARREGAKGMLITQTSKGLLSLRYDAATKTYTLTRCGMSPEVLAVGAPKVVAPALAALYVVEYQ